MQVLGHVFNQQIMLRDAGGRAKRVEPSLRVSRLLAKEKLLWRLPNVSGLSVACMQARSLAVAGLETVVPDIASAGAHICIAVHRPITCYRIVDAVALHI